MARPILNAAEELFGQLVLWVYVAGVSLFHLVLEPRRGPLRLQVRSGMKRPNSIGARSLLFIVIGAFLLSSRQLPHLPPLLSRFTVEGKYPKELLHVACAAFAGMVVYDLLVRTLAWLVHRKRARRRDRLHELLVYSASAQFTWFAFSVFALQFIPNSSVWANPVGILCVLPSAFFMSTVWWSTTFIVPRPAKRTDRVTPGSAILMLVLVGCFELARLTTNTTINLVERQPPIDHIADVQCSVSPSAAALTATVVVFNRGSDPIILHERDLDIQLVATISGGRRRRVTSDGLLSTAADRPPLLVSPGDGRVVTVAAALSARAVSLVTQAPCGKRTLLRCIKVLTGDRISPYLTSSAYLRAAYSSIRSSARA